MYSEEKCVLCGGCAGVCESGAHSVTESAHVVRRDLCVGCGRCAEICSYSALEVCGKQMSTEEALCEVMKDKVFYETSGGGVTLSGGEPLYSFDFSLELLKLCKEKGLHTAIETCGFAPRDRVERIAEYVDLFLFDCKETDPVLHKSYTGVDNSLILSNLSLLDSLGKEIVLRCPIIPGYNDRKDHLLGIAALAEKYRSVCSVDVEPYHPLGESKSSKLGEEYALSGLPFAEKSQAAEWIKIIGENTKKPVRLG
jgi:pyruvate formate lyase activating enzyme